MDAVEDERDENKANAEGESDLKKANARDSERDKKKGKQIEVIRPTAHICETHDTPDEECNKKNQVGVERKLLKNGGVTKMVVKPGTCSCSNTPLYGDQVTGQF